MDGKRGRAPVYLGREEVSCVGGRGLHVKTVQFLMTGRNGKFAVSRR